MQRAHANSWNRPLVPVCVHALLDSLSDTVAHFGFKLYLVFTLVLCSESVLLKATFTAYQRLYSKQTVQNYSFRPWFSFFPYYLLWISLHDQTRILRRHVAFPKGFNSQRQFRFTLHVKEVVNMFFLSLIDLTFNYGSLCSAFWCQTHVIEATYYSCPVCLVLIINGILFPQTEKNNNTKFSVCGILGLKCK